MIIQFGTIQNLQRALLPQTSNWSGTIFGRFLQQTGSNGICNQKVPTVPGGKKENILTIVSDRTLIITVVVHQNFLHFSVVQVVQLTDRILRSGNQVQQNRSCFDTSDELVLKGNKKNHQIIGGKKSSKYIVISFDTKFKGIFSQCTKFKISQKFLVIFQNFLYIQDVLTMYDD